MKKIVAIAIRHPEMPNLFLHGLRRDNHRWALAGGHAKSGEIDSEAASRELEEETGLKGVKLDHMHENMYGDAHVHLFSCEYPEGFSPYAGADPDSEFVTFKFLDPTSHDSLHIPKERNILVEWMNHTMKKPEPVEKSATKIKVESFAVDPGAFNPKNHDFIVKAIRGGKQVGFLAVTHTPSGDLMPFNFEVNRLHRRKGIGTTMAAHAQKISGKKIVRSRDMTQDAVHWANSFIKDPSLKKAEPVQKDLILSYPVTVYGRTSSDDGKPFRMVVKNFGPMAAAQHPKLHELVSAHDASVPIQSSKLVFVPQEIAAVGRKKHVLVVHGMPEKLTHLMAATSPIGPTSSSNEPHVEIDEPTFKKLSSFGPAISAEDAGIIIHPLELTSGIQVLRTY